LEKDDRIVTKLQLSGVVKKVIKGSPSVTVELLVKVHDSKRTVRVLSKMNKSDLKIVSNSTV
jgi:hypothetical protein